MDPRRLLTFRMVAHERSFSRAATALSLTQPSVSQQVAALETELGARLIDRTPGGLTLTRAGEVALEHADVVADRLGLARRQLAELAATEAATLRVGANPSAVGSLVPPLLAAFAARDATASVRELRSDAMADAVRAGELHLAITFQDASTPRQEPEGLERIDLLHEPFVAALPPGHRLADAPSVRLADLADEPWTAPSTSGIVVGACRAAGFEPRIVAILSDLTANRAMILGGHGITLVAGVLADHLEGVVLKPLDPPGPSRDVFVLLPPGGRHPLVPDALDVLRAAAAARV